MKMSNELYDILNKIQRWLPYLGIFYLALCKAWNLPLGQQVNNTIIAIAALLAATLEISTAQYHKGVMTDMLQGMASSAFDEETPSEDGSADAE